MLLPAEWLGPLMDDVTPLSRAEAAGTDARAVGRYARNLSGRLPCLHTTRGGQNPPLTDRLAGCVQSASAQAVNNPCNMWYYTNLHMHYTEGNHPKGYLKEDSSRNCNGLHTQSHMFRSSLRWDYMRFVAGRE